MECMKELVEAIACLGGENRALSDEAARLGAELDNVRRDLETYKKWWCDDGTKLRDALSRNAELEAKVDALETKLKFHETVGEDAA